MCTLTGFKNTKEEFAELMETSICIQNLEYLTYKSELDLLSKLKILTKKVHFLVALKIIKPSKSLQRLQAYKSVIVAVICLCLFICLFITVQPSLINMLLHCLNAEKMS